MQSGWRCRERGAQKGESLLLTLGRAGAYSRKGISNCAMDISPTGLRFLLSVTLLIAGFGTRQQVSATGSEAEQWSRFRGPNGSGVAQAVRLPLNFDLNTNLAWKTALPAGHSSPVIHGNRVFITGFQEKDLLLVLALDSESGRQLWRKQITRTRAAPAANPYNNPASPSPVTDGENVYAFFQDFGLVSYSVDGAERWNLPLGPFRNNHGMGTSPIIYRDLLILVCDQDVGSFLLFIDKNTGKVRRRIDRSELLGSSYSTPTVYERAGQPALLIVPGSFQMIAYRLDTGEKQWWLSGLPYSPRSVPLLVTNGRGEDLVLLNVQSAVDGEGLKVPGYEELLARYDTDKDRKLTRAEVKDYGLLAAGFPQIDIDGDGYVSAKEWQFRIDVFRIENSLVAVRANGRGDISVSGMVWKYGKSLPNVPSPIVYRNVMYLLKEGGILTSMDPASGRIYKQARLTGALEPYFASPVAADGKLYLVSQNGKVVVIRAGADWEVLAINELNEECFATPAIAGNSLFVRSRTTLYRFREGGSASHAGLPSPRAGGLPSRIQPAGVTGERVHRMHARETAEGNGDTQNHGRTGSDYSCGSRIHRANAVSQDGAASDRRTAQPT
jgi:outer membrane protein assembly factor BamB